MEYDRYLITFWGCTDPEIIGPFLNEAERDEEARKSYTDENCIAKLNIHEGIPTVEPYSVGELEEEEGD